MGPVSSNVGHVRKGVVNWPDKNGREAFEIDGFIKAYARLPGSPHLTVVGRGEKPDFVVENSETKTVIGVELTAVYMDDLSVPLFHKAISSSLVGIPFDRTQLEKYEKRLISAIIEKVCKARKGYDISRPLILAIYVNEYISIYLGQPELDSLRERYKSVFEGIEPFSEVVLWNLGNAGVYQIKQAN